MHLCLFVYFTSFISCCVSTYVHVLFRVVLQYSSGTFAAGHWTSQRSEQEVQRLQSCSGGPPVRLYESASAGGASDHGLFTSMIIIHKHSYSLFKHSILN